MKPFLGLLLLLNVCLAGEPEKPLLLTPGKVISQPDLQQPLGPEWSVGKGKWDVKDGVVSASEIPEEHHAAVLHLAAGPVSLIFECEFRLNAGKIFYIGCDGNKHVGRLVVTPGNARLLEDSTEVKGVSPGHTLAESAGALKPDEWQHLRVEYTGNQLAARLNERELKVEHPYLGTPKVRWWIATSGSTVDVRNIRVSEGTPLTPDPAAK